MIKLSKAKLLTITFIGLIATFVMFFSFNLIERYPYKNAVQDQIITNQYGNIYLNNDSINHNHLASLDMIDGYEELAYNLEELYHQINDSPIETRNISTTNYTTCNSITSSHGSGRRYGYHLGFLSTGCSNYKGYSYSYSSTDIPYYIDESTMTSNHAEDVRFQVELWNQTFMHDGTGQIVNFYEVDDTVPINNLPVVIVRETDLSSLYAVGKFTPSIDNPVVEISHTIHPDTPLHEFGHVLGLDDLDSSSNITSGTHKVLMGYNRKTTTSTIDKAIQYQDIQGIAVLNNRHTEHQFTKYIIHNNKYVHLCFYCDMADICDSAKSGSSEMELTTKCEHTFRQIVSAGDRHWIKCKKCYHVLEYSSSIDSPRFAVDFISNEQVIESWSVYKGSIIENLPNLTLTGYDFGGWYDNPDYTGAPYTDGGLWESSQTITLYAKLTPKDCTIFFDGYGGIVSGDNPITVKYGETISTNITANKTGNVLDGWYDNNNVLCITADGRSTKPWDKLGTTTLKAKWSPKSYEIQINDDGSITWLSENGLSNDKCYIQYGTVLSSINLIAIFKKSGQGFKEGKIFDHFEYNDSTLDWTSVPDLGENNSVITIVPIWINEVHTIHFMTLCDIVVSPIKKEYGSSITLPTPSRTGYIFDGWYTAKTGGTRITWTTMPDLTPSDQNNGSTELFARWTPITYRLYYNANGGSGTMNFTTHTYGVSFNLPKNIFVKTGHDFTGWATSPGGQVVYTDGQQVQDLAYEQSKDIELFAVWQPKKYSIIYKNLADNMTASPNYYWYGVGMSSLPLIWVGEGSNSTTLKRFYGWYTTNTFTSQVTSISKTRTGTVTLYAKYDYMLAAVTCSGPYTVTDDGKDKNPKIDIKINLQSKYYEKFKNTTVSKVRVEVSFNLWEVDDGYQYIYLRNDADKSILWKKEKIDHAGGKKKYTYTIEVDLEKVKNTDSITFLFDASGAFSDDWKFDDFEANVYLTN